MLVDKEVILAPHEVKVAKIAVATHEFALAKHQIVAVVAVGSVLGGFAHEIVRGVHALETAVRRGVVGIASVADDHVPFV